MAGLKGIFERFRPKAYGRRPPLILINGLAEQTESWFRNRRFWSRYFDVFAPNIMIYDGGVCTNCVRYVCSCSTRNSTVTGNLFSMRPWMTPPS